MALGIGWGNPFSGGGLKKGPNPKGLNLQATGSPVIGGSNLTPPPMFGQPGTSYPTSSMPASLQNAYARTWQSSTPLGPAQDPVQALMSQLRGVYSAQAAPMLAGLDKQNSDLEQRRADLEGAYGARGGAASSGAALQQRGVDLDEEKLNLERAGTQRQIPFLDQLLGLRTGQRGASNENLKARDALGEADLALNLFGADAQQTQSTRKQRSDATAAGAVVTQGNRDALGDIDTTHDIQTKAFRLDRQRDALGIKAQWDDNYWSQQIDEASTKEEKSKITDRLGALDIAAKELGLRREQIANSLAQTLANMNLDKVLSVGQILDAMNGNNEKAAQAAWEIFQRAHDDAQALAAAGG